MEAANLSHCRGGTQQTLYEFLDENHDYEAFTDSDIYLESRQPPTQDFVRKVLDSIFKNLYRLVGSQSPENADFKMATRHGLVEEKGVYKLSFRCYLFGFKIKLKDMRDLIVNKGLDENGLGSFDIAPYNKTQLLGCVGFAKSQTDGRMLLPTVMDSSEPGVLEGFMVQNLTGEEPTLTNDDDTPVEANNSDHAEGEPEMDLKHSSSRFCPPWDLLEKCIMALSVDRRCKKGTMNGLESDGRLLVALVPQMAHQMVSTCGFDSASNAMSTTRTRAPLSVSFRELLIKAVSWDGIR